MPLIHESFQHLVLAPRISYPASKAVQLSIHDTFPLGASHASTGNNLQALHPQYITCFPELTGERGGATSMPPHTRCTRTERTTSGTPLALANGLVEPTSTKK